MKVLAVGRNYVKHARELGNEPPPSPIWFWKPDSAIIHDGQDIELPAGIGPVHHEVELAVRLGRDIRRIDAAAALRAIDGITVANDLTARDLQEAAKKAGLPWAQAKGYDTFLPMGEWHDYDGRDLQELNLRLTVAGRVKQSGNTRDMTFGVAALLAHASSWTTLKAGDILLTGTPEGVGPVEAGKEVEAEVVGVARVRNPVIVVLT